MSISTNLGRGDKIGTLLITNDEATVRSLITSDFDIIAGSLEVNYLLQAGTVIVYLIEDREPFPKDEAANEYLLGHLMKVRMFLQMLWLIKDNAANIELGFVEYPYKQSFEPTKITRNFYSTLYSDASGKFAAVEFSREELRKARHLFRDYVGNVIHISQVEKSSRFSRALYFLQAARSNPDLGVKIANYCTAFEALFSTDTQELSHKLSERIACFLESDADARKDLFKEMKKSYTIRSTVVHGGSAWAKQQSSVLEAAKSCDRTLRRVLYRILETEALQTRFMGEGKDKDAEDYFLSLVLGNVD